MRRLLSILILLRALAAMAQVPQASHVVVVLEENTNYSSVIGSSSMPYLNSLATHYGLATQYYANTHPSIGNYFMLTTGQILTNDDSQTPSSFPVSADNVVRHLITAGKTWKAYEETLPSVGYTGGDVSSGGCTYYVRHDPLAYMADVQNSSTQKLNLVPFTQFATDLSNNALPNYSFITPNGCDDAHDGTLAQADTWLQTNIAPLLTNSQFTTDGILVIVFDESASDNINGGGRVVWVVVSPMAKKGYQSTATYQHQSTLRMMSEALGLTSFPGAAATAPQMGEFFGSSMPVVQVAIAPTSATVASGATQQFTATVSNTTNKAITWSATAGSVSSSGLYTAPAVTASTTTIVTATSVADPSKSAGATVSITAPPPAVAVSISPTSATVASGATQQFTATVSNTTNKAITWSATAGSVASSGLYTAPTVTANTTTIVTATSVADPSKSAGATVSITPPSPTGSSGDFSLSVTPGSQTVGRGSPVNYTVSVNPSGSFTGAVSFSISGLPSGATASFSTSSVDTSGSSILTVTTNKGRTGTFILTIEGVSGNLAHTTSASLTITRN